MHHNADSCVPDAWCATTEDGAMPSTDDGCVWHVPSWEKKPRYEIKVEYVHDYANKQCEQLRAENHTTSNELYEHRLKCSACRVCNPPDVDEKKRTGWMNKCVPLIVAVLEGDRDAAEMCALGYDSHKVVHELVEKGRAQYRRGEYDFEAAMEGIIPWGKGGRHNKGNGKGDRGKGSGRHRSRSPRRDNSRGNYRWGYNNRGSSSANKHRRPW